MSTHWHVSTAQHGVPLGVLQYDDGYESVKDFLKIVRAIFVESDREDPVSTEAALIHNLHNENYPIYAGEKEGLMVIWGRCNCKMSPQYN